MKIFAIIIGFVFSLFIFSCKSDSTDTSFTEPQDSSSKSLPAFSPVSLSDSSLRYYAEQLGFYIGSAVAIEPLIEEDIYGTTLAREFNILSPENAMKFETIHPSENNYYFYDADTIIDFAEINNMKVRGHTLVWHDQLPEWLINNNWSRDQLIQILRDYIFKVVGRYKGRVAFWDVVNEAFDDDGFLRNTIWSNIIGSDYIEMAFRWANDIDPNAMLFYNDYFGPGLERKADSIYSFLSNLISKGVPIHGVGFQMHLSLNWYPTREALEALMKRFSSLGLEVHITEMDVALHEPPNKEDLNKQADIYQAILEACLNQQSCTAFVMWGFTDRYSWIPINFEGMGSALIFDYSYNPKPAYDALIDALKRY